MKIGFDISQTGSGRAGCGCFAWAMIRALTGAFPTHRYVLYSSFGDYFLDPAMAFRPPLVLPNVEYGPQHTTMEAAFQYWTAGDLQAQMDDVDVLHANNFWCPAALDRTRVVYTLYDLSFLEHPEYTTEANRVGCFAGIFRAVQWADWVVAVSEATRSHFRRVFPNFPPERVVVIHPCSRFATPMGGGVRPRVLRDLQPRQFWLSVGTLEPRKNHQRLAEAYARYLAGGGPRMPLVFVGGGSMEEPRRASRDLGIEDMVVFAGYVSDEELVWLYENCYGNVYVSLFEGFGLPVLEGMQAGAPTIASAIASIPEVAGDAAMLVDPLDSEALAQALLRVAGESGLREALAASARVRAGMFERERTVARLEALYRTALASPKRAAVSGSLGAARVVERRMPDSRPPGAGRADGSPDELLPAVGAFRLR